jgi:hypothetical protein
VLAILNGERINKQYTYRTCYLLAKYFKSLGQDSVKIRESILDWSSKYQIYISDDLNSIIQKALHDNHELISEVEVKISQDDIDEIKKRFDKYNTQITAFAILCFAKIYADDSGVFKMSSVGLSNWTGIARTNMYVYLNELIDFKYIEKISKTQLIKLRRKNKTISKLCAYKINVNYNNKGGFVFYDNNIQEEFEKLF